MKNNVLRLLGFVLGVGVLLVSLQGCGGSNSPPPDANPTGYYDASGTASVNGGALTITDLQALVNGTRIMMMSTANGLLYDGTITNITQNSFTADFTIYTDGQTPITATVSGTITQGSSITGTLTGTGAGSGTFSLTYATNNNQLVDLGRISRSWDGNTLRLGPNYRFLIDPLGALTSLNAASTNVAIFFQCEINGQVTPISGTSIYDVAITLTNCADTNVSDTNYTGLVTSRTNSAVDDTLVFMVANGTYSPNGDIEP